MAGEALLNGDVGWKNLTKSHGMSGCRTFPEQSKVAR